MLCPKCGAEVGDEIRLCDRCERRGQFQDSQEEIEGEVENGGSSSQDQDADEAENSKQQASGLEPSVERPAGFWLRAIAYIFDASFTLVLTHVFQGLVFSILGISFAQFTEVARKPEQVVALLASGLIGGLLLSFAGYLVIHLLYYALFESSERQATPGKIILGLRVTDLEGKRLSFAKSAVRHLASGLSVLTFGVGFILAGFGERKQALHDRISGCLITRVKARSAVELVTCVLGSLIFAVVCQSITSSETPREKDGGPIIEQHEPVPTKQTEPVIRRDGGSVTYDDHVESLKSTRIFWSAEDSLLEIRFYPAELEQLLEADYTATVVVGLRPGEIVFDKRSITACFIRILDRGKEIEVPCDGVMSDAVKASGTINYLTGDVSSSVPLVGSFEGSAQLIQNSNEPQREFRWLLEFNAAAQDRDTFDRENRIVGERDFSASLALFDRAQETVTIAFFRDELTDQDISSMRDENSVTVISDNLPVAQAVIKLKPKAATLQPENIVSCVLRYAELPESAALDITQDIGSCDIQGELREASKITGQLRGNSSLSSESFSGLLSWKLPIETALVDVETRGQAFAVGGDAPVRGYVKAGSEGVEFKSAIVLFSRKSDRLEIGFYALDLSAADRAAIEENGSFFIPVRDRRANFIFSVRFAPGVAVADVSKIIEANVYVVRDVFGGLYFPGQYERQSIARTRTQLSSGELRRFSGDLKDGAEIQGLLKGESVVATLGQTFAWKADFKATVVEIK